MGTVMPFRPTASIAQYRKLSSAEELALENLRLWFAWARVVNRIWWGA